MVWEKGKEKEKRGGNSLGLTLTQGRVEEGNGGEGKGRCGDLFARRPRSVSVSIQSHVEMHDVWFSEE